MGHELENEQGKKGLTNLGNTCFMNTALQCLAHTTKLVEFFLQDYTLEINKDNPLGMKGELAKAFGQLIRDLWKPGMAVVTPNDFKTELSRFALQFQGYIQHDSQELLAFLLDGLHEDLNRVKSKPYLEMPSGDGRPDTEVADESWAYHKARNDSIIVDLFQGQYKSTLVCPACNKVSVTFDPFMYMSLPLPAPKPQLVYIELSFTVFSDDGGSPFVITVPVSGQTFFEEIYPEIKKACNVGDDKIIRVVEIFHNTIFKSFTGATELESIKADDTLAVFILANDKMPVLEVCHEKKEGLYLLKSPIGCPFYTRLPEGITMGEELYDLIHKKIVWLKKEMVVERMNEVHQLFRLYVENGGCNQEIDPDLPLPSGFATHSIIDLRVEWSAIGLKAYDIQRLENLAPAFLKQQKMKLPHEEEKPVSLYTCLNMFVKEEPLGSNDMWYCPTCKEHRQAIKKMDIWRLPEILVVHLKRFRSTRNKLETLVEFPMDGLDMREYTPQETHLYELYAVSHHSGTLGFGHYTASAKCEGQWVSFSDSFVTDDHEERIRSSSAYVLFYRRKRESSTCRRDYLAEPIADPEESNSDMDTDGGYLAEPSPDYGEKNSNMDVAGGYLAEPNAEHGEKNSDKNIAGYDSL